MSGERGALFRFLWLLHMYVSCVFFNGTRLYNMWNAAQGENTFTLKVCIKCCIKSRQNGKRGKITIKANCIKQCCTYFTCNVSSLRSYNNCIDLPKANSPLCLMHNIWCHTETVEYITGGSKLYSAWFNSCFTEKGPNKLLPIYHLSNQMWQDSGFVLWVY